MNALRCYWKIQAHLTWLVPFAVLGLLLVVLFYERGRPMGAPRRAEDLYFLFEVYFPLTAGLWMAGVPVVERENGVAEVHLSCPSPPSLRVLQMAVAPAAAWVAMTGLGVLVTETWYVQYDLKAMAAVTAAPALVLSGAAVAASALARQALAGIAVVVLWWFLDLVVPGVLPELHIRNLLMLGLALWGAALWLSHRREWWVR